MDIEVAQARCDIQQAEGYDVGDGGTSASGHLTFNKAVETQMLKNAMDEWGMSSRCCSCPPHCEPGLCGIAVINQKGSGHCKNILFERCKRHGGNGHQNTLVEYTKSGRVPAGTLLYGYSVNAEGEFRPNSGTFNGYSAPSGLLDLIGEVRAKVKRSSAVVRMAIPWIDSEPV